jgi:hypothetical protein
MYPNWDFWFENKPSGTPVFFSPDETGVEQQISAPEV